MSVLYFNVYVLEGRLHQFAAMFARALLLDISEEVIVPSYIWDKADTYC